MTAPNDQKLVRELNDKFRQTFEGGRVMMTQGVDALDAATKVAVITQVRSFNAFNSSNDPWDEHDFGSFEIEGNKFFWKIDAYDESMEYASPDPTNPDKTTRVLTIMLAEEY